MDVQQFNVTKAAADAEHHSGDWQSKPAIAATTVPVMNESDYTMWVEVVGGTVTAVTVDGVSVGRVVGMFLVKPGGTIALTYSVAPTWKWFAL